MKVHDRRRLLRGASGWELLAFLLVGSGRRWLSDRSGGRLGGRLYGQRSAKTKRLRAAVSAETECGDAA